MEDGAKENTALNIQKPLEILVTDEDKHGTDIACMSDFFGIYIEQLSAELSNQVMRGVVEKIPAADVQILGELVHGVDVLLSGKYGYIPDFDSLPNDVKDKLKKGIYTLGESRQVEDNVRAVVLDENGTRIKDVTLKRVLNTPDTLEMSRSITSQVQMRQIAAKLDEIAETQCVKDLSDLYALVMTGYILDDFGFNRLNIEEIVKGEQLTHKKNQYGLSVVNGVVFHNDYFVFENKAYLYNILTNIIPVSFGDVMPGFARVISEQREVGNILLRLDDRLALPEEQAISYSTLNFEKYRGPQFHFKDTLLKTSKTISVHFNGKTMDKLLMVVKQKFDEKENKSFWHIELETLPYRNRESKGKYCITTFLHGMYYPDEDIFTHIDYTKNQYDIDTYLNKYSDCNEDMPIDTYTSSNELHYKIWCIEGGKYSRETWYRLMVVSLNQEYVELLDEILE